MRTYTIVTYFIRGISHTETLEGRWKLKAVLSYVKKQGGDNNFTLTRSYYGHKSYFEVKDGELNEVQPEHFINHSITLQ